MLRHRNLEVRRRLTVKSPSHSSKEIAKKPRNGGSTGICYTEDKEPYISMWPTSRTTMNLKDVPRQSVQVAAQWARKEWQSK